MVVGKTELEWKHIELCLSNHKKLITIDLSRYAKYDIAYRNKQNIHISSYFLIVCTAKLLAIPNETSNQNCNSWMEPNGHIQGPESLWALFPPGPFHKATTTCLGRNLYLNKRFVLTADSDAAYYFLYKLPLALLLTSKITKKKKEKKKTKQNKKEKKGAKI